MVYLYHVLKEHFRKDFDWVSALLVFLFAGILVILHYQFHLIKDSILSIPHLQRIPLYWVLYSMVFTGSCGILYFRKQIPNVFVQKQFWLLVAIAFLINALDQSYFLLSVIKEFSYPGTAVKAGIVSIATHSVSLFSVIIPVALCGIYFRQQDPPSYGLTLKNRVNVKPYFAVLSVALIMVLISTAFSGIGSYYPVYHRSGLYRYSADLGLPRWAAIAMFETVYASDFIAVELFFRGFMIFSFARLLGKQIVLPMAACYMIFHFGKPLPETISSFFGGYILGVFALHSRNIWGGIILHIGTALFMELAAGIL